MLVKSEKKKLKKELKSLRKKRDKIHSKIYEKSFKDSNASFPKIQKEIKEKCSDINDKISDISYILKKQTLIEFTEIDENNGDLMTMQEFVDCCESGGFIDYDGFGYYATKNKRSDKVIIPSNVKNNKLLDNPILTHVIWYNR